MVAEKVSEIEGLKRRLEVQPGFSELATMSDLLHQRQDLTSSASISAQIGQRAYASLSPGQTLYTARSTYELHTDRVKKKSKYSLSAPIPIVNPTTAPALPTNIWKEKSRRRATHSANYSEESSDDDSSRRNRSHPDDQVSQA